MGKEGWLERDGVGLHYLDWAPEQAREPALFLLHGLSANALYWSRLAARFPERRLVALDQRSHGASDQPGSGSYSTADLVADAARAIEALELGRPVVVGHSWGCTIALDLAGTRPDLVAGLGIVDGPAAPMSERLSWEDAARLMQPALPRFADRAESAGDLRPYVGEAWADDLQEYAETRTMRDGDAWVLTLSAPVRLELLRAMYDFQPQLFWAQLRVPVLLALARAGPPMIEWKQRGAELVQSLVDDVAVSWYDSAHDIPLIKPDELATDVRRLCLRSAWRSLAAEVASLEGDWARPTELDSWTAKDLLAHLASSVSSLPAVLSAPELATLEGRGARSEPFDSDRWNATQVLKRADRGAEELLGELESGTAALEAVISKADLDAVAAVGPYAGRPLSAVMEAMLDHQRSHMAQLRAALA